MTLFPIPDEFYADPTFITLTDAAIVLWARAGSWSAHHLTDGFVRAAMLPTLHRDAETAAEDLVQHGVWKRARGGFQYVDWPKLASRSYVEAKREGARSRQQRFRTSQPKPSRRESRVTNGVTNTVTNGVSHTTQSSPVQEEKEPQTPTSSGARKRGSRIPDDFAATPDMVAWAREHTPLVGKAETANFVDYWTAAAGANASKRDWTAAWRTWMRKAQADAERRRPAGQNGQPTSGSKRMDKALAALAPDDPFRAQYAANQAAAQQPTDWLMIEGGQPA